MATVDTSSPSNAPCFASSTIRGTWAWQCGHQCATNIRTWGVPVGPIVIFEPSNDSPPTVGIGSPRARSLLGPP